MSLDLFPAQVILPDGTRVDGARVQILDDGRLYVWDAEGQTIRQRLAATVEAGSDLPSPYQSQQIAVPVSTDAGTVTVRRSGGCGCGSPLRGRNPLGEAISRGTN